MNEFEWSVLAGPAAILFAIGMSALLASIFSDF
jgi:hypothetical protein